MLEEPPAVGAVGGALVHVKEAPAGGLRPLQTLANRCRQHDGIVAEERQVARDLDLGRSLELYAEVDGTERALEHGAVGLDTFNRRQVGRDELDLGVEHLGVALDVGGAGGGALRIEARADDLFVGLVGKVHLVAAVLDTHTCITALERRVPSRLCAPSVVFSWYVLVVADVVDDYISKQ